VLRADGETETMQENIQDWLEVDEGDPGFQLIVFLMFLFPFIFINTTYIIKFSIYLFSKFIYFLSFNNFLPN
jgi:hypothetical protein